MVYMVTFTINIPQMLAYIPYMDPMGYTEKQPFAVSQAVSQPPAKKTCQVRVAASRQSDQLPFNIYIYTMCTICCG